MSPNGPDSRRSAHSSLSRVLSHPAVCVPAAVLGSLFGLLALWYRLTDIETLETLAAAGIDLRVGALAFGLVGARVAAGGTHDAHGRISRVRSLVAVLGVTGAMLGAGLIVVGLVGVMF